MRGATTGGSSAPIIIGDVAIVPLTRGMCAIIDAADVATVVAALPAGLRWYAMRLEGHRWYAVFASPARRIKSVSMHRLLCPGSHAHVDHRNGNGLDNRRGNLRPASVAQNAGNSRPHRDRHSSPFKGVAYHRLSGLWRAEICKDGQRRSLGYFKQPRDAALAYDAAARFVFGEFARPNFPTAASASACPIETCAQILGRLP